MVRSVNYSIVNLARRELLPTRSHRWLYVSVGLLLFLCGCKKEPPVPVEIAFWSDSNQTWIPFIPKDPNNFHIRVGFDANGEVQTYGWDE